MIAIPENYALYHTLVTDGDEKELGVKDKRECISMIASLEAERRDVIFLLICEHARFHEDLSLDEMYWNEKLPYGCVQNGTSIKIDFAKLPSALQWAIFRFLQI